MKRSSGSSDRTSRGDRRPLHDQTHRILRGADHVLARLRIGATDGEPGGLQLSRTGIAGQIGVRDHHNLRVHDRDAIASCHERKPQKSSHHRSEFRHRRRLREGARERTVRRLAHLDQRRGGCPEGRRRVPRRRGGRGAGVATGPPLLRLDRVAGRRGRDALGRLARAREQRRRVPVPLDGGHRTRRVGCGDGDERARHLPAHSRRTPAAARRRRPRTVRSSTCRRSRARSAPRRPRCTTPRARAPSSP